MVEADEARQESLIGTTGDLLDVDNTDDLDEDFDEYNDYNDENPAFEEGSDTLTTNTGPTDPLVEAESKSGEPEVDARELGKNEPLNRQAPEKQDASVKSDTEETVESQNPPVSVSDSLPVTNNENSYNESSDTQRENESEEKHADDLQTGEKELSDNEQNKAKSEEEYTSPTAHPSDDTLKGMASPRKQNFPPNKLFAIGKALGALDKKDSETPVADLENKKNHEDTPDNAETVTQTSEPTPQAGQPNEMEEDIPAVCPYCGEEFYAIPQGDKIMYCHRDPTACRAVFFGKEQIEEEVKMILLRDERQRRNQKLKEEQMQKEALAHIEQEQENPEAEQNGQNAFIPDSDNIPVSDPPADMAKEETVSNIQSTTEDASNEAENSSIIGDVQGQDVLPKIATTNDDSQYRASEPNSDESDSLKSQESTNPTETGTQTGSTTVTSQQQSPSVLTQQGMFIVPSAGPNMQPGQSPYVIQGGISPSELLTLYNMIQQESEKQRTALEKIREEMQTLKKEVKFNPASVTKALQELPEFKTMASLNQQALQLDEQKRELNNTIKQMNATAQNLNASATTAMESLSQYVNTAKPLDKLFTKMKNFIPGLNEYLAQVDAQYKNILEEHQESLTDMSNYFIDQSNKFLKEAKDKGFLTKAQPRTTADKLTDYIVPTIIAFVMMLLVMVLNK